MVYPISKITLLLIFRFFIKRVNGLENIPKEGAFIIAANHQSFLDPGVIFATFIPIVNKKIHFFALPISESKFIRDYIYMRWAGSIPVSKTKRSRRKPLKQALHLLDKGEIIGIFPEGTRTFTGELLRAKTGVAKLALSGVPIVPVGISGAFEAWPRQRRFPKFKRDVKIKIGRPIYFKSKRINKKILHKVADQIMRQIGKLINKKYSW